MLPTYPAILRAGRLDWGADGPPVLPPDAAVAVHVTILASPARPSAGGPAMAALTALADAGGPSGFDDPIAWQREVRADRPLPGRSE